MFNSTIAVILLTSLVLLWLTNRTVDNTYWRMGRLFPFAADAFFAVPAMILALILSAAFSSMVWRAVWVTGVGAVLVVQWYRLVYRTFCTVKRRQIGDGERLVWAAAVETGFSSPPSTYAVDYDKILPTHSGRLLVRILPAVMGFATFYVCALGSGAVFGW